MGLKGSKTIKTNKPTSDCIATVELRDPFALQHMSCPLVSGFQLLLKLNPRPSDVRLPDALLCFKMEKVVSYWRYQNMAVFVTVKTDMPQCFQIVCCLQNF